MKKHFRLIFFGLVFFNCSSNEESGIIEHPTEINLRHEGMKISEISLDKSDLSYPKFLSQLSSMLSSVPYSQIGKEYGEEYEVFGFIKEIQIDQKERIYLLDERQQIIQVYSKNGEYLTTLGSRGKGPGEFERASSMDLFNDQLLVVGNGFNIEVFDISGPDIVYKETKVLDKSVHDLCVINNKLIIHENRLLGVDFVLGKNYKNILHEYDLPDFSFSGSFGQSYKSNSQIAVDRLSTGSLLCDPLNEKIIFTFEKLPIIHGYSASNKKMLWMSLVADLNLFNITEDNRDGRPSISYKAPDNKMVDRLLPIKGFDDEYMMLQVDRRILPNIGYEAESEILTVLINVNTGSGNLVSNELPRIFYYTKDLVASVSEDFMSTFIYDN